jgi:(2R)-ethylmalonyl-CoA mutase
MQASIACAKAGVTTGEWAECLRNVFGQYRAPTGISMDAPARNDARILELRDEVERVSRKLGRTLTLLVAKPGLDGHSNGAEQIAIRARDVGVKVVYNGIRFSPEEIVAAAKEVRPHVIGLSILSGSHVGLVKSLLQQLRKCDLDGIKVVAGGIIPPADERILTDAGVRAVFSPRDYDLNAILREIISLTDST